MSITPHMYLIFGVDDFVGETDSDDYETRLYLPIDDDTPDEDFYLRDVFCDQQTKEWAYIHEVLYHGEYPDDTVLGLILGKAEYDSDIVRALSIFHPEYEESGKKDIPVWDRRKNSIYTKCVYSHRGELPSCGDITFQWSWFYPSVIEAHYMWPVRAYCARWLLRQVGIEVDYRKLKAMLVWEWI